MLRRLPDLPRATESVSDRHDTVCVIGAGASGLTAVKNLREHGFAVDCYERETSVGGAWNWRHDRSPVYASTHLISSRPFTEFPDFPMPDTWPDYPHHSRAAVLPGAVRRALRPAAAHLVRHRGRLGGAGRRRPVGRHHPQHRRRRRAHPAVRGRGGRQRAQLVAEDAALRGAGGLPRAGDPRVGVQGPGAAARHARCWWSAAATPAATSRSRPPSRRARCWHSTRRGYWYAPKYVLGRPADQVNDTMLRLRLPLRLRQWLYRRTLRLTVGDLTRFGLPDPGPPPVRDATRSSTASSSTTWATAGSPRSRT